MYNMLDPLRRHMKEFIDWVTNFVSKAVEEPSFILDGGIRFQCVNCKREKIQKASYVRLICCKLDLCQTTTFWLTMENRDQIFRA